MLMDGEVDILVWIARWRKTTKRVLERTFYEGRSPGAISTRVHVLCTDGYLKLKPSGAIKPKSVIVLGEEGSKESIHKTGLEPRKFVPNPKTIVHSEYEQIVFFWLSKPYPSIKRTVVHKTIGEGKTIFRHTPDMLIKTGERTIYIEVELTLKSCERYNDILTKSLKDGASLIYFITPNLEFSIALAKRLPKSQSILIIELDMLINNIKTSNKIAAKKQVEYLGGLDFYAQEND